MKRYLFKLLATGIIGLTCFSCQDLDDNEVVGKPDPVSLITEESELFGLLERVADEDSDKEITCIDFIYAFTLIEYNADLDIVGEHVVQNDQQFSDILGDVPEGNSIGLNFPITSVLDSGEQLEINTKEELKESIDECVEVFQEEVVGQCSGLLQECVWVVHHDEDDDADTYENAVFDVADDGTIKFYNNGVLYEGTWIVYFIEDELHTNINITDTGVVGADWNFDWKTTIVDNDTMEFVNDDEVSYTILKECEEENYCTLLTFPECETTPDTGIAEFVLEEYIPCILEINDIEELTADDTIAFYETEMDANNATFALNQSSYQNTTVDEQTLYVRIDFGISGEFVIIPITIRAEVC